MGLQPTAVPVDADRDQDRRAGDHAGLAHPLIARVEDQIGEGFGQRAAGKLRQARVQPLVHRTDRGSRKAVAAQLIGDRLHPRFREGKLLRVETPCTYISASAATSARRSSSSARSALTSIVPDFAAFRSWGASSPKHPVIAHHPRMTIHLSGFCRTSRTLPQISVGRYSRSSTAFSAMRSRQVVGSKSQGWSPTRSGLSDAGRSDAFGRLKRSRARPADRARQAADGSVRGASPPSDPLRAMAGSYGGSVAAKE